MASRESDDGSVLRCRLRASNRLCERGGTCADPPASGTWQSSSPRLDCCRSLPGTRCAVDRAIAYSPSTHRLSRANPGTAGHPDRKRLNPNKRSPNRVRSPRPASRPPASKPSNRRQQRRPFPWQSLRRPSRSRSPCLKGNQSRHGPSPQRLPHSPGSEG